MGRITTLDLCDRVMQFVSSWLLIFALDHLVCLLQSRVGNNRGRQERRPKRMAALIG